MARRGREADGRVPNAAGSAASVFTSRRLQRCPAGGQMKTVLVTGASSFLGYHVARRLNERGVRPRVLELPGARRDALDRLEVERAAGHLQDPDAVRAACRGVDTLLHLAFKVSVGGGAELLDEMRRVNIDGTRQLLQAAAAAGVRRAVVAGSALAVGVNRAAEPLNESAAWSQHAFDIPYAQMRREAEAAALATSTPDFVVVSACPSFTFGPDDPTGAPANTLLGKIASGKQRFTLTVGFGCLDVRDFADGVLLAAERGRSGERYLLSGENVTADELLARAGAIAGVRPTRFRPPAFVLRALAGAVELYSRIRHKPAPITRDVLQIIGRYAWYDTTKARTELGWTPRPLDQTLADTIAWLRHPSSSERAVAVPAP
jgi:dihydroflavonol-4-reductase